MKNSKIFLATTILSVLLAGCASTNTSSYDSKAETNKNSKLNDITISKEANALLASENDESAIKEELICKREKQIGTHFKKKVCYTRAQLDAIRKASKKSMSEIQNSAQRSSGIKLGESGSVLTGN